jgi:membrane-bound lytic murein transglycosylase D
MKLYERFSSALRRVSTRKPTARKLLLRGTATLALSAGLWVHTATQEKPLPQVEPVIEQATEPTQRGLSRQRKDFDKALDILADAASSDGRLTGYFTSLQRRLQGEPAPPVSGSGVRVVKRVKKSDQPVERKTLSAAGASVPVPAQARPKNVWAKMKGFIGSPMMEDSQPSNRETAASPLRLTVGDVEFQKNPAIERWIDYYTASERGRQTMQIGINRSGSYINLARAEFRRLGVPEDLVWLAHVESVWHMTAMSPAAAGGLWQFIPSTAKDYGLTVSQEYDERLDPEKQTQVAAAYLRDLYTIFGDWALAMAAYNCGEPRVMNAVVKNGNADFWELHEKQLLPQETLNYVPKILAAIEVAGQAERYGFSPDSQPETSYAGR